MATPVVDLVVTLLLSVVPALLFLGLFRGLKRLRDDELVEQLLQERDLASMPSNQPPWLEGLDGAAAGGESERRRGGDQLSVDEATTCPACGAVNSELDSVCTRCLEEL